MATDAEYDLSANVFINQAIMSFSRDVQFSDETQMAKDVTDFITEKVIATGNSTLSHYSETPYRGGFRITIILT